MIDPSPLVIVGQLWYHTLPDRRGLGKAKITDRINRIDKIHIKILVILSILSKVGMRNSSCRVLKWYHTSRGKRRLYQE